LGHNNFNNKPDYNDYDVIIDLENYDNGWVPNLSQIKSYKIIWSIDAHCRGIDCYNHKFNQNKCQLILQATKDYVDKNSIWFPNCFDDTIIYPKQVQKRADVGFCGNVANRQYYLDFLAYHFNFASDIFVIGDDMVNAINSYRIHFNKNIANDINYRSFETLGCRIPLITNYNKQYEELGFVDGKNCMFYKDINEIIDKIQMLLSNEKILNDIAEKGYLLSRQHTYNERAKSLMVLLEKI
jgi:spore maturation protein CgeB